MVIGVNVKPTKNYWPIKLTKYVFIQSRFRLLHTMTLRKEGYTDE